MTPTRCFRNRPERAAQRNLAAISLLLACTPIAEDIGDEGGSGSSSAAGDDAGDASASASASMSGSQSASATADDDEGSTSDDPSSTDDAATDPTSGSAESDPGSSSSADSGETGAGLVVFVQFEGAMLVDGPSDDSATDTSTLFAGQWPPYGIGDKRDEVLALVQADWAAYDAAITDVRPAEGDYVMVMVGPGVIVPGGLGIAPLDCGDGNRRNIAFVQTSIADALSAEFTAAAISREAAHTLGFENVEGAGADMFRASWNVGDPEFTDECLTRETPTCAAIEVGCADPNAQNAHAALLELVGPA
jgi:hypothetical protein